MAFCCLEVSGAGSQRSRGSTDARLHDIRDRGACALCDGGRNDPPRWHSVLSHLADELDGHVDCMLCRYVLLHDFRCSGGGLEERG